jgi:hypothetical protein
MAYQKRFKVFKTRWLELHLIKLIDVDPNEQLHSHNYDYLDIVLWGSYREIVAMEESILQEDELEPKQVRWFNFKKRGTLHKIIGLYRSPTWTLKLSWARSKAKSFEPMRAEA